MLSMLSMSSSSSSSSPAEGSRRGTFGRLSAYFGGDDSDHSARTSQSTSASSTAQEQHHQSGPNATLSSNTRGSVSSRSGARGLAMANASRISVVSDYDAGSGAGGGGDDDQSVEDEDASHSHQRSKQSMGPSSSSTSTALVTKQNPAMKMFQKAGKLVTALSTMKSPSNALAAMSSQAKRLRRYVPYIIVRPAGAIARSFPDKNYSGKMIPCEERVMVCARKVVGGTVWLKTPDGWIPELMSAGSTEKVIKPATRLHQPLGARILSSRFIELEPEAVKRGWFYSSPAREEKFQTYFLIEVQYPDQNVVKISRSFAQIASVRRALLSLGDKQTQQRIQRIDFTSRKDGEMELLAYTSVLVEFVDEVGRWLNEALKFVNLERSTVKEYINFITPTDDDCKFMEIDLMSDGGMDGAWEDDLQISANPS